MTFFIANDKIDDTIKRIKVMLRTNMNGELSEQMENRGVVYKKNYGIDIPRIKSIASNFPQNHDLAQRLWALSIRETMILATLLQPIDKISLTNTLKWANDVNQNEMAEQLAFNLFSKLPFGQQLCLELIGATSKMKNTIGFHTATHIYKTIEPQNIKIIIEKGIEIGLNSADINLTQVISRCLSRLCRLSKETASEILNQLDTASTNNTENRELLKDGVNQEIEFVYGE